MHFIGITLFAKKKKKATVLEYTVVPIFHKGNKNMTLFKKVTCSPVTRLES